MNLRDALQTIYNQRGALTPAIVVAEATNPDHPLHTRFEWDDSIAAARYREVQAAQLIRSVRVTYATSPDGEPKTVRGFLPVQRDPDDTRSSYEPVEQLLANDFQRELLLREFDREWKLFKQRYGHLREFAELVKAGLAA